MAIGETQQQGTPCGLTSRCEEGGSLKLMKVWLDDRRSPRDPDWVWVKTPEETIELLQTGQVTELSLDHDLGLLHGERERTGYDVLIWLEQQVALEGFRPPPVIKVHSSNSAAAPRMGQAIKAIQRLHAHRDTERTP
jgi:hypothetical protein